MQKNISTSATEQTEQGGVLSTINQNLNPFSQKNRTRLADIPSDIKDTFQGMTESVTPAITKVSETRQRVAQGETTPLAGTGEIIGGGLKAGAGVVGEGLLGFGKLFTTPEEEEKVKKIVAIATEAAAGTRPVQEIKAQYDALDPQTQRNVQSFIGAAEGIGTMFGAKPVFDVLRRSLSGTAAVTEATISAISTPVIRTGTQAVEDTIAKASATANKVTDVVQPAADIAKGTAQQFGSFVSRTAKEAQDVAETNRRLASLPEPAARIRKSVSDERVIDLVDTLTPEELAVTRKLVDQAKLKQKDITTNTAHPKTIVGQELLKPVEHIINTRKSVGANLGELRKQLDNTKNINTNSAFRSFHSYLKDNYKVQFDQNGNIIAGTGNLAKTDVPAVQELYNELRSGTFMSQQQVDQFLQRSFKDYDLRQAREQVFSDDVSRIAERARHDMRQLMPEQYNALATEYAKLSKPLVDFVKILGYKGDLDAITTKELKTGEIAMRVLGNAADRPQSVIDELVKAANDSGYKSDVNLNNIIAIADQLEGLYDVTMPRSFTGQVTRGVEQSQTLGTLGDAATLNIGGLYNRAMSSQATQKEIQEAFDAYLQYLIDAQKVTQ